MKNKNRKRICENCRECEYVGEGTFVCMQKNATIDCN